LRVLSDPPPPGEKWTLLQVPDGGVEILPPMTGGFRLKVYSQYNTPFFNFCGRALFYRIVDFFHRTFGNRVFGRTKDPFY